MQEKYKQQKLLVQELASLMPENLLKRCNDLNIAKLVLSLDVLLDKFGKHVKSLSNVPVPFYANKEETYRANSGYYLFEFLKLHKSIYEEAQKLDIVERLSIFQIKALQAFHSGNEQEFFKEHHFYENNKSVC